MHDKMATCLRPTILSKQEIIENHPPLQRRRRGWFYVIIIIVAAVIIILILIFLAKSRTANDNLNYVRTIQTFTTTVGPYRDILQAATDVYIANNPRPVPIGTASLSFMDLILPADDSRSVGAIVYITSRTASGTTPLNIRLRPAAGVTLFPGGFASVGVSGFDIVVADHTATLLKTGVNTYLRLS